MQATGRQSTQKNPHQVGLHTKKAQDIVQEGKLLRELFRKGHRNNQMCKDLMCNYEEWEYH